MVGKKLLVADDSLTIQKVIRLALSNEGYEIQTTSDGNDALQQISVFRPHVVLIDVALPGRTAFELKQAVNENDELRGVRFVLMSSVFEKVDENHVNTLEFHGRLTKPFDPAHLRKVLSDVLEVTSTLDDIPPPPAESMDIPIAPSWGASSSSSKDELTPISIDPTESETDDIKKLTESTLNLNPNAVDDFGWSIQEPVSKSKKSKKTEAPAPSGPRIPPRPSELLRPSADADIEPTIPPPPSMFESGPPSNFMLDLPDVPSVELDLDHLPSQINLSPSIDEAPDDFPEPMVPGLSSNQMEAMIQHQVEIQLERMAKRLLPELAEKVIKDEIHRMLKEQG